MKIGVVANVLGGPKVLGRTVKKADDLAQLVREGLPANSVTALAEKLDLGNSVLSQKLGIPLRTPNRALGGERPLDQLDTDIGARAVEDILGRIAYGVYS